MKKRENDAIAREITSEVLSDNSINRDIKKLLKDVISVTLDSVASRDLKEQIREQILTLALVDSSFRQGLQRDAKQALKSEFNLEFPESVEIEVVEETPTKVYLVIPHKPCGEKWEDKAIW